jgi:hypothetical protein
MAPRLYRVTEPYGVAVLSAGGFDTLTDKHQLADEWSAETQPTTVLRIADYDPPGESMFTALLGDIGAFATESGGDLEFVQGRDHARAGAQLRTTVCPAQTDRSPRPSLQRYRNLAGRSSRSKRPRRDTARCHREAARPRRVPGRSRRRRTNPPRAAGAVQLKPPLQPGCPR